MTFSNHYDYYRDRASDWFYENGIEEYVEATTIGDPLPVYMARVGDEWMKITCHEMGIEMAYGNIKKLKTSDDQVVEMEQHNPKKGTMSIRDVAEAKQKAEKKRKDEEEHRLSREASRGEFIELD